MPSWGRRISKNTSITNHRPRVPASVLPNSSIQLPIAPAHHPCLPQVNTAANMHHCLCSAWERGAGDESTEGQTCSQLIKCTGFAVMVQAGHVGGRYALPSFSRFFLFFGPMSAMLHVHQLLSFMLLWLRAIRVAIYT